MGELVGREAELEAIARFLDRATAAPSALVLTGEEGIGKTSLLDAAVARARVEGFDVLTSRPAPSEGALSFAGLSDLVAHIERQPFDSLPAPQRRALDVALMLEDPRGPPPSQLAISLAFSTLVASLEARQPVLIAIDDVQWLDDATIEVLAFLVRRLSDERLGLIVATPLIDDPLLLDRSFQELRTIELGPLRLDELFHLLRARTGRTFPHPTLVKIRDASRGNPFFALEIARAIVQSTARTWTGRRCAGARVSAATGRRAACRHAGDHTRDPGIRCGGGWLHNPICWAVRPAGPATKSWPTWLLPWHLGSRRSAAVS